MEIGFGLDQRNEIAFGLVETSIDTRKRGVLHHANGNSCGMVKSKTLTNGVYGVHRCEASPKSDLMRRITRDPSNL